MKQFADYVNDDDIELYLCGMRAKIAKQRNKKHIVHMLTKDNKFNYHQNISLNKVDKELDDIMPSRKQWKKLGEKERYKNSQILNSIDKNILSLRKTILAYKKNKPDEEFLKNLEQFVARLKNNIIDESFKFHEPDTYPKLKVTDKGSALDIRQISLNQENRKKQINKLPS
jgi:hypothetical protein